ncbi:hypothetical protein ACFVS9_06255 [Streptomyces sp. NPDC058008]|uniref:hypothetical protein n=1 Tax=Streptomyces sp. NPDC058008 TaxID=3346303 RepID=UPI0036E10011
MADVLWFVEGCDDEQLDPDAAVMLLEGFAHLVRKLSSDQHDELADLLATMAEEESDPVRREFLTGFPDAIGLFDDTA